LADGSFADWELLKEPITKVNVATALNLMLVVSACVGGAFAKVVRMRDQAPFWGLIGPTKPLTSGELDAAWRALYLTLLSARSAAKAFEALRSATEPGSFVQTTAPGMFLAAWASYKETHCGAEALEVRARRMIATRVARGMPPRTIKQEMRGLIDNEPAGFERFRQRFFMCDLYPENAERFPIEYAP
jgi:hypothetical protein